MTLAAVLEHWDGQDNVEAVNVPSDPSTEFLLQLEQTLQHTSRLGALGLHQGVPITEANKIVKNAITILKGEPTLIEVQPSTAQLPVIVVGDTHGQYHDLCRIFELKGHPSKDQVFIFNGDYVDRGAWGVETLLLLLAWKWLLPHHVYLLRGNHEGAFCTKYYGFMQEVAAKYGTDGKSLYHSIMKLFACLPLAALVEGQTLILHGGLFRVHKPTARRPRGHHHRGPRTINDVDVDSLKLGTVEDLRSAGKGGVDPDPERSLKELVASDVIWSDPSPNNGFRPNLLRGVGNVFGPDATEQFCVENKLRLIIRSHEGPDARHKRAADEKMPSMHSGYSVDHAGQGWRLVTLFSAPDYPMFMADGEARYNNKAAVLTLSPPGYATPAVTSFEAVLPRPQACPYYELDDAETDHGPDSSLDTEELSNPGSPTASSGHADAAMLKQQDMHVMIAVEQGAAAAAAMQSASVVQQADAATPPQPHINSSRRVRSRHAGS